VDGSLEVDMDVAFLGSLCGLGKKSFVTKLWVSTTRFSNSP